MRNIAGFPLELGGGLRYVDDRFADSANSVTLKNYVLGIVYATVELSPNIALTGRVKAFPNVEQDLLRFTRDVKVNNELYANLLNSYQQLRLVKEGKVGNVRVVDVAAVPERAVKPQRAQIVALAAVLGLRAARQRH